MVNATAPIFVIVDGHPAHRAKSVTQFVAAQQGQLALFHLPPYSPELNPDEMVWNDLKTHGTGRKLVTHRRSYERPSSDNCRTARLGARSLFDTPTTRYACL
jgi:transposase